LTLVDVRIPCSETTIVGEFSTKSYHTVTTINGRRVPKSGAKISVFDNALLYADGVFETFLAIGKHVVFLEEHLDRLYRGASVVGLKLPVERTTLARWMVATVAAHPDNIKKLRLTITSGESPRWTNTQGKPQVILSTAPHRVPTKPFRLLVSDFLIEHNSIFRWIKTLSYVVNASALKRAIARGCDDALLLNTRKQIAEITSANIFWVRKNRIFTPSPESGCLGGVTRLVLIEEARKLGYRVDEVSAGFRSLLSADELFLTSSLKLALPISTILKGDATYTFKTGPVTRRLSAHMRKLVGLS
jgi:branched-chain amino acid aminotransferase